MMEFLDTVRNHKDVPNENYARELQELFTLGVDGPRAATPQLHAGRHRRRSRAPSPAGATTATASAVLRRRPSTTSIGRLPGARPEGDLRVDRRLRRRAAATSPTSGEGASEIDRVIDIIFAAHATSTGKNTVARRTARRLLRVLRARRARTLTRFVDEVVADVGLRHRLRHRARCSARSSATTTST